MENIRKRKGPLFIQTEPNYDHLQKIYCWTANESFHVREYINKTVSVWTSFDSSFMQKENSKKSFW